MNFVFAVITAFIQRTGYIGVFLWMALSSACIPIPSEAVMPFAGALVSMHHTFNFHVLALTGAAGDFTGAAAAYWIGAAGGRPFLAKYGRYVLIHNRDIVKAEAWYAKAGEATVYFGRIIPLVRAYSSLPAGLSKMQLGRFCAFTLLGSLTWSYALTTIGYNLGTHWGSLEATMHKADLGILIVLVVLIAVWAWRHMRGDESEATSSGAAGTGAVGEQKERQVRK